MDDRALLRTAADRLDALAARTTAGDWRTGGLLATRPEVIAHRDADGEIATEHVAEARAGTAAWISALSPAVGPPARRLAPRRGRGTDGRAGGGQPWRGCCSSGCPDPDPAERLVDREHERDEEDHRRRAGVAHEFQPLGGRDRTRRPPAPASAGVRTTSERTAPAVVSASFAVTHQ